MSDNRSTATGGVADHSQLPRDFSSADTKIFAYRDGTTQDGTPTGPPTIIYADPLDLYRKLYLGAENLVGGGKDFGELDAAARETVPGEVVDPETGFVTAGMVDRPVSEWYGPRQQLREIAYEAFGVKPYDPVTRAGLTHEEIESLLERFLCWMDAKKKRIGF